MFHVTHIKYLYGEYLMKEVAEIGDFKIGGKDY
jgi:hypothetical protein